MKALVSPGVKTYAAKVQSEERRIRKWSKFLLVTSALCLLSAAASLITNILTLTSIARGNYLMNRAALLLTILFFATGGLTAHCLDKVAESEKAARLQKLRERDVLTEIGDKI